MKVKSKSTIVIFVLITAYVMLLLIWQVKEPSSNDFSFIEENITNNSDSNENWKVLSGGILDTRTDEWKTIQGELNKDSIWKKHYLRINPLDSDNGYHPQNVFKLVSTENFLNPSQELIFKVNKTNLSPSPNRNEDSGVFLYSRYINDSNYYIAGLNMSGEAVIIKKQKGTFVTLFEKKIFDGIYDREENPNLIESTTDIGIRSEFEEIDTSTKITLYISKEVGIWEKVGEYTDNNPISISGNSGIKSDFMDVVFKNYLVRE